MFDDSKIMDNEPNFQEKESYPTIIKIIGAALTNSHSNE